MLVVFGGCSCKDTQLFRLTVTQTLGRCGVMQTDAWNAHGASFYGKFLLSIAVILSNVTKF